MPCVLSAGVLMPDVLEDVGIGLLLPAGELVPAGDVGGFGVGDVLMDLIGAVRFRRSAQCCEDLADFIRNGHLAAEVCPVERVVLGERDGCRVGYVD
jgi:hypothetical protein